MKPPDSAAIGRVIAKGVGNASSVERSREAIRDGPGNIWKRDSQPPSSPAEAHKAAVKDAVAKVGEAKGALATAGAAMGALAAMEQAISAPLSAIPFPAFPAVRITDKAVGLPHAHMHPPNLIPPAPPVPLPSMGPVIYIPFLSGASTVLINGLPAARCGDLGVGIWCGGYFPLYEIFLGSSSVWIEGSRAARLGVDITKHCVFSTPRPSDPPLGPMIGTTITGSPNVVIGGIPMPSLSAMAVGAAFKLAFKGLAKVAGAVKGFSRKAIAKAGQLPRKLAYLAEADPARRVLGPASKSHPEEIAKMRKAMEEAGVEIKDRPGALAYSPGLRRGEPGQVYLDPDASYSAWKHEYQHFLDDKADGWSGMGGIVNRDTRWAREQSAYAKEIEMMEEMGHHDVADELRLNMEEERMKIFEHVPGA
jgi:uncharacterized Zn-binding protein involved in type VI secretion